MLPWSEQLKLWLGTWTGEYLSEHATWLRSYDTAGKLVPRKTEAVKAELEQLKARIAQNDPSGNV
jgi:hypothetical protein